MANDLAEVRGLKTGMHYYRLEPKGLEKNVAGDLLAR